MGIYYNSTTNEEDINYIQKLIDSENGYIKDGCIYWKCYGGKDMLLWETCKLDTPSVYFGEQEPINTPWGLGKLTKNGTSYIFMQLAKEGRSSSTY
jgi:hypothetical protein